MSEALMQACVGCAQEIGGREEQQDRVGLQVLEESTLLIVADGMGGHAQGSVAAEIMVNVTISAHRQCRGRLDDPASFFKESVRKAWEDIRAYALEHRTSPHTTCVMALVRKDRRAWWAHLGDSRLYRLRPGAEAWHTLDHSVVQLLVLEGTITDEELATHPEKNTLYRSIGGDRYHEPSPGRAGNHLEAGEILLLCSDGFWERVQPHEAIDAVCKAPPPEAAAALAHMAGLRGGANGDNVSVVLWVTPPA